MAAAGRARSLVAGFCAIAALWLWLGQTVSFIGDYFNWLAIPILVERMTGSALMVGLSVISNALPALFLGPVAGVFVDRWDRKRTMIVADVLRALLVLACLTVQTADQVWVYYVVGFMMSCVSRFFFPAQNAVLPLVVSDEDDLLAANGLMQIVQTVGLLAGPALAGVSIELWGEQAGFVTSRLSKIAMIGWGLVLIGAAFSGIGFSPGFGYVVAFSFIIGLALVPAPSALMTIMQLAVPDLKRGRVGSAVNALTMATSLLSMAGAAALGEVIELGDLRHLWPRRRGIGGAGLFCAQRAPAVA